MMRVRQWTLAVVSLVVCAGSVVSAASKPSLVATPKSIHLKYSLTWTQKGIRGKTADRITSDKTPVEYWISAPNCARWVRSGGGITTSSTWDGKDFVLMDKRPNQQGMMVGSADRNAECSRTCYSAGVETESIPFLGFQQPGKVYRSEKTKLIKTRYGWEERCKVPHGWRNDKDGNPEQADALLTYDSSGRLVRFQRYKIASGLYEETYDYKNFKKCGDFFIPRLVTFSKRYVSESDKSSPIISVAVYKLSSFDLKPVSKDFFSLKNPPVGTVVSDYRYIGSDGSLLLYTYSGETSIDAQSKAEYSARHAK